jgi:hypothetical protein
LLLRDVVLKSKYRRECERDLVLLHEQLRAELQPVGRLEELVVEEMAANLFVLPRCEKREHAELQKQVQQAGTALDAKIAETRRLREKLESAIEAAKKIMQPFLSYEASGWEAPRDDQVRDECLQTLGQFKQRYEMQKPYPWEPEVIWSPPYDLKRQAEGAGSLKLRSLVRLVVTICRAPVHFYQNELGKLDHETYSEIAKLRSDLELAKLLSDQANSVIARYEEAGYRRVEQLHQELEILQSLRQRKKLLRALEAEFEHIEVES